MTRLKSYKQALDRWHNEEKTKKEEEKTKKHEEKTATPSF